MKIERAYNYILKCVDEEKIEGNIHPNSNGYELKVNCFMMKRVLELLKEENDV